MPRWSWVAVVLVACGSGNAARTDAGSDAAPADAHPAREPLRASPVTLAFGSQAVGTSSAPQVVTITNYLEVATGALGVTFVGPNSTLFTSAGTCTGASLAPGATCTATVVFAPTALGAVIATLQIAGMPGGTVFVVLSGTGVEGGFITITPALNDFGNALVGAQTAVTTFTIGNAGGDTTVPLAVALGGASPADFTTAFDGCSGQAIAPGSTCTIGVSFKPLTNGDRLATLAVTGPNVATAALTGTGVVGPELVINPAIHDFGVVGSGLLSGITDFTITNTGGAATGTPTALLAGQDPGAFQITGNTCTAALAPGASCTVSARFAPAGTGDRMASLAITAAPGGTATASLAGQGVSSTSAIVVSPSELAFGSVAVGASGTLSIAVANPGATADGLLSTTLSGTDGASFQVVASSCTTLAPNTMCAIDIAFSPTSTGAKTAGLLLVASPGGSVNVPLSGTGN